MLGISIALISFRICIIFKMTDKKLNGSIKKVTVLKKPNHEQAMNMLMRCVKITVNLMKKRNWVVSSMNEFIPKENNLLGLNINRSKIMIRLRPPGNEESFYPFEHVLGTVLHELVHMSISPHNAAFDALLETLWTEVEAEDGGRMLLNNIGGNTFTFGSGSGDAAATFVPFSEKGHVLGSAPNRKRTISAGVLGPTRAGVRLEPGPNSSQRVKIANAAVRRQQSTTVGSGGGCLLGSSSTNAGGTASVNVRDRVLNAAVDRAVINNRSRGSCGNSIRITESSSSGSFKGYDKGNLGSSSGSSNQVEVKHEAGSGVGFVDLTAEYDLPEDDDADLRFVAFVDEGQLELDYQRALQSALQASLVNTPVADVASVAPVLELVDGEFHTSLCQAVVVGQGSVGVGVGSNMKPFDRRAYACSCCQPIRSVSKCSRQRTDNVIGGSVDSAVVICIDDEDDNALSDKEEAWQCKKCTYCNSITQQTCAICGDSFI